MGKLTSSKESNLANSLHYPGLAEEDKGDKLNEPRLPASTTQPKITSSALTCDEA